MVDRQFYHTNFSFMTESSEYSRALLDMTQILFLQYLRSLKELKKDLLIDYDTEQRILLDGDHFLMKQLYLLQPFHQDLQSRNSIDTLWLMTSCSLIFTK